MPGIRGLGSAFASLHRDMLTAAEGAKLAHETMTRLRDVMRDVGKDARGGDTLFGGDDRDDPRGGDTPSGTSTPSTPANTLPRLTGLRAGTKILVEMKKQLDEHMEKGQREFDDKLGKTTKTFVDNFDKRDKALREFIEYVMGRASAVGWQGQTTIAHIIEVLKDLDDAKKRDDVKRASELMRQLKEWKKVIDQFLVGSGNANFGPLDLDRLIGGFTGGGRSTGEHP